MTDPDLDRFVRWARLRAAPLDAEADLDDFTGLEGMRRLVGDARIVGVGESQHHVRELSRFRARLFHYLVAEAGFNCFVFECGVVESKPAHDYVLGLHDDADAAFTPIESGFNVWQTLQALVHWMRRHNLETAGQRKLKFYGMDGSRRWMSTSRTVEFVCAYLDRVNPEHAQAVRASVLPLAQAISLYNAGETPEASMRALVVGVAELVGHLRIEQLRYVALSGYDDFDWAFRAALIAQRIAAILGATRETPEQAQRFRAAIRDAGMAIELKWILEREGSDARLLLGAHNTHLQKVAEGLKPTVGRHLALTLPADQVVMIAGTNALSLKPDDPPAEGSFQAALEQVGPDSLVLDLRDVDDEAAAAWLEQPRPDRTNTGYQTLSVGRAWDAVFFTRELNVDTLSLPGPYARTFVPSDPRTLDGLDGVYDVTGIGDSHVVLEIRRQGDRLLTSGLDSDGELFPMGEAELKPLATGRYAWPHWAWEVEFDAHGLALRAPGAIDSFRGVRRA